MQAPAESHTPACNLIIPSDDFLSIQNRFCSHGSPFLFALILHSSLSPAQCDKYLILPGGTVDSDEGNNDYKLVMKRVPDLLECISCQV